MVREETNENAEDHRENERELVKVRVRESQRVRESEGERESE